MDEHKKAIRVYRRNIRLSAEFFNQVFDFPEFQGHMKKPSRTIRPSAYRHLFEETAAGRRKWKTHLARRKDTKQVKGIQVGDFPDAHANRLRPLTTLIGRKEEPKAIPANVVWANARVENRQSVNWGVIFRISFFRVIAAQKSRILSRQEGFTYLARIAGYLGLTSGDEWKFRPLHELLEYSLKKQMDDFINGVKNNTEGWYKTLHYTSDQDSDSLANEEEPEQQKDGADVDPESPSIPQVPRVTAVLSYSEDNQQTPPRAQANKASTSIRALHGREYRWKKSADQGWFIQKGLGGIIEVLANKAVTIDGLFLTNMIMAMDEHKKAIRVCRRNIRLSAEFFNQVFDFPEFQGHMKKPSRTIRPSAYRHLFEETAAGRRKWKTHLARRKDTKRVKGIQVGDFPVAHANRLRPLTTLIGCKEEPKAIPANVMWAYARAENRQSVNWGVIFRISFFRVIAAQKSRILSRQEGFTYLARIAGYLGLTSGDEWKFRPLHELLEYSLKKQMDDFINGVKNNTEGWYKTLHYTSDQDSDSLADEEEPEQQEDGADVDPESPSIPHVPREDNQQTPPRAQANKASTSIRALHGRQYRWKKSADQGWFIQKGLGGIIKGHMKKPSRTIRPSAYRHLFEETAAGRRKWKTHLARKKDTKRVQGIQVRDFPDTHANRLRSLTALIGCKEEPKAIPEPGENSPKVEEETSRDDYQENQGVENASVCIVEKEKLSGMQSDFAELKGGFRKGFRGDESRSSDKPEGASQDAGLLKPLIDNVLTSDKPAGQVTPVDDEEDTSRGGGMESSSKMGISAATLVDGVSKLVSSLFLFDDEPDDAIEVPVLTDEVVAFARNVSFHPETWLDFALALDDDLQNGFQMNHAYAVERAALRLAALICPRHMNEGRFWLGMGIVAAPGIRKRETCFSETTSVSGRGGKGARSEVIDISDEESNGETSILGEKHNLPLSFTPRGRQETVAVKEEPGWRGMGVKKEEPPGSYAQTAAWNGATSSYGWRVAPKMEEVFLMGRRFDQPASSGSSVHAGPKKKEEPVQNTSTNTTPNLLNQCLWFAGMVKPA
ncbi:hypothetical protein SELMODRAFT_430851 [Selaginella moellendorffii]|uniref:Uncharacterized protein n=1 Tax=Selaginella moellendorffii TaxID=88036 RepID=D8TAQ6_SELML|nr:hypothetical protein SELMODRAFT_430851 [Selaginella moellendorffii]